MSRIWIFSSALTSVSCLLLSLCEVTNKITNKITRFLETGQILSFCDFGVE